MKINRSITAAPLIIAGMMSSQSVMALSDGDALNFGEGSYFEMHLGGGFWLPTQITAHDGIIIGQEQPASGSHSGGPDGSENSSIDEPWMFFGNTGMHQTVAGSGGVTIIGDDGAGNFELAFNGFGVTWNGIPNIDMSGPTGVANLTCTTAACGPGAGFVLDYEGQVPYGDPSGFGGVQYRLHLEGNVNEAPVNLNLEVNVVGGTNQECSEYGGSTVQMTATFDVPQGDELQAVTWNSDGVMQGTSITKFFPLGNHNVLVSVVTKNGLTDNLIVPLSIEDNTPPSLTTEFIGAASGAVITEIDKERKVNVHVEVQDVCDPQPVITYSRLRKNDTVDVQNGDVFMTLPNGTTDIHLLEESLRLDVGARDASNNIATASETLIIR